MFDYKNSKPEDIWDNETGETVGQALERFKSFGEEIPWTEVMNRVLNGDDVWSFGYGDDPKEFTTLSSYDIVTDWDEEIANQWAPFRC